MQDGPPKEPQHASCQADKTTIKVASLLPTSSAARLQALPVLQTGGRYSGLSGNNSSSLQLTSAAEMAAAEPAPPAAALALALCLKAASSDCSCRVCTSAASARSTRDATT